MQGGQPTLSSFVFFIVIGLSLTSCSFFGNGYHDVHVYPCNSSPATVVDSIPLTHGRMSRVIAEIDGVPVQKWVILPDAPSSMIYDPCNLPNEAKVAGEKIYFTADILSNVLPVQDTVLNGFTPIEITHLQIK
jgi:hypothetical protein